MKTRLLKFTTISRGNILIHADKVIYYFQDESTEGTEIYFINGDSISVKETFDEIVERFIMLEDI